MNETWRPIPGFPDYEASDLGRIKSLSYRNTGKPRVLVTYKNCQTGYLAVRLYGKDYTVHSLVLLAFIGPRPAGRTEIRHLDGTQDNNSLSNLRYGTPSENRRDVVLHGHDFNVSKSHCPSGHAYDAQNTYTVPSRPGWRYCRACDRERSASSIECDECGAVVRKKGMAKHRRTTIHAERKVAA